MTGPSNDADVTIFDISTKTIQQVGTILVGERINEVRAAGHELYIIGDEFIKIYDLSNTTQPTLTNSRTINSDQTSIIVDNDYIYTTQLNDGLFTYVKDNTTFASEIPSSEIDDESEIFSSYSSSDSDDLSTTIGIASVQLLYVFTGLIVILTSRRNNKIGPV